jgi:hypothetical protein
MQSKCSHCGSENVCIGSAGEQYLRFRPENMKFLTLSLGAKPKAIACLDCGLMSFWIDPDEVKAVMRGESEQ